MRKSIRKIRNFYIGLTAFDIIFASVYGMFSHGVSSNYMTFAFLYPLLGIVVPHTIFLRIGQVTAKNRPLPSHLMSLWKSAGGIYRSAVVTWMLGSIFMGVLKIYGTTNHLSVVYWITGAVLMAVTCVMCLYLGLRYRLSGTADNK